MRRKPVDRMHYRTIKNARRRYDGEQKHTASRWHTQKHWIRLTNGACKWKKGDTGWGLLPAPALLSQKFDFQTKTIETLAHRLSEFLFLHESAISESSQTTSFRGIERLEWLVDRGRHLRRPLCFGRCQMQFDVSIWKSSVRVRLMLFSCSSYPAVRLNSANGGWHESIDS